MNELLNHFAQQINLSTDSFCIETIMLISEFIPLTFHWKFIALNRKKLYELRNDYFK